MILLHPFIAIQIAVPLVVGLIYFYLYSLYHKRYLLLWALSWIVYAVRNMFHLGTVGEEESIVRTIVYQSCAPISGLMLMWGNYVFLGKPFRHHWVLITAASIVWIAIGALNNFSFLLLTIPVMAVLALIYFQTGLIFLRFLDIKGIGKQVVGWAFVALGIHRGLYPVTRPTPWLAPYAYLISAVLGLIIGLGTLILYFQRTRQELEKSEEKYRTLFEDSRDAIYISSREGNLIDVNASWLDLFCYKKEEVQTLSVGNTFVIPKRRFDFSQSVEEKGSVRDYEARLRRKDGTEMDCLITATVRRSINERVIGYQGIVRDITELKKSERLKALGSIAAGVSHEVRNPLNAILSIVEALNQELRNSEEYKPFLQHIRTQAQRLSELMRDLLELGKPLRGLDIEKESLRGICEAAIDLWTKAGLQNEKRIKLLDDTRPDTIFVMADNAKLQQVFLNLFDNACLNSPDGNQILVFLSAEAGHAVVKVVDTGTGITSEDLPHVFEPFFTGRKSGTGLGLTIVQQIIRLHDGEVMVKNNESGTGCTVRVALPIVTS